MKYRFTITIVFTLFFLQEHFCQVYPPPAGHLGTTAMHKDSSAFVNWAVSCKLNRGYQDVSNLALGVVTTGDTSMATGKAMTNGIVSLGDGGWAICTFPYPIKNGLGNDFAVFENSFDNTFLELAFVEVSSDGINFFRFPSHSLSDTVIQTWSFGLTDATKINNLAGKYRGGYGTPFDLQELANKPGLNIDAITQIKIIDVVGSLTNQYATRDSYGNKINDPWSTPFASGGFDLDAIGVIHENVISSVEKSSLSLGINVFPNPVKQNEPIFIESTASEIKGIEMYNMNGEMVDVFLNSMPYLLDHEKGIYLLKIYADLGITFRKIVVI